MQNFRVQNLVLDNQLLKKWLFDSSVQLDCVPINPFLYLIIPLKATGGQLCCVIDTAKSFMTGKTVYVQYGGTFHTYLLFTIVLQ